MYKRIYIEITNICNLQCAFCEPSKRNLEYMTLDMFQKILESIRGLTNHIYLHVKGEPLLHPRFKEILELSHHYGYYVHITTNGTMINIRERDILEAPAVRQMSFSLQSLQQVHELEPILTFTTKAIDKKINVELRLWNLDINDDHHLMSTMPEITKDNLAARKNHEILERIQTFFSIETHISEGINQTKGVKLKEHLYLSQSYQFQWPTMKIDALHQKGTCYGLRQQLAILVDGTVVPCCLDNDGDIALGNICHQSIKDILSTSRAIKIKTGFEQQVLVEPLCRRCGFRERFNM